MTGTNAMGISHLRLWNAVVISSPLSTILFPVIFLAQHNRDDNILFVELAVVIGLFALTTLLGIIILYAVYRDINRSSGMMLIGAICFWIYPLIDYSILYEWLSDSDQIRERYVLIYFTIVGFVSFILLHRYGAVLSSRFMPALFWVGMLSGILLIFNSLLLASDVPFIRSLIESDSLPPTAESIADQFRDDSFPVDSPDIFYFVFDALTRDDVVETLYGFENPLSEYLVTQGFDVLDASTGNYVSTQESIFATLSMEFPNLAEKADLAVLSQGFSNYSASRLDIEYSQIAQILSSQGYQIRTVSASDAPESNRSVIFSPFSELILSHSILKYSKPHSIRLWLKNSHGPQNTVDSIQEVLIRPETDQPIFTFIYAWPPHSPSFFRPDGTLKDRISKLNVDVEIGLDVNDYIESLQFVNTMFTDLLDTLFSDPEYDPIVIVQGDHGIGGVKNRQNPSAQDIWQHTAVYNAIRLAASCTGIPPNDLSSVNTFRFLMNACFDSNLELLPNTIYWSTTREDNSYRFSPQSRRASDYLQFDAPLTQP